MQNINSFNSRPRGFLEIARSDSLFGEIINIGMNEEISIGDLFNLIADLINIKVKIVQEEKRIRPRKSEVDRLLCDNSKILKKTNWKIEYDLEKGILETIEFLKKNSDLYKSEEYNV